jgi:hypothetical protein
VLPVGSEDADIVGRVVSDEDAPVGEEQKTRDSPEDVRVARLVRASDGQVYDTAKTLGGGLSAGSALDDAHRNDQQCAMRLLESRPSQHR